MAAEAIVTPATFEHMLSYSTALDIFQEVLAVRHFPERLHSVCDYSLELYKSRPAEVGENVTLHRFPSSTLGFITDGTENDSGGPVAVCMIPGATMVLSGINEPTRKAFDVSAVEEAVFAKLDKVPGTMPAHHDGVRFANGREVLLQSLNPGCRAQITGTSPELTLPATAAPDVVDAD